MFVLWFVHGGGVVPVLICFLVDGCFFLEMETIGIGLACMPQADAFKCVHIYI